VVPVCSPCVSDSRLTLNIRRWPWPEEKDEKEGLGSGGRLFLCECCPTTREGQGAAGGSAVDGRGGEVVTIDWDGMLRLWQVADGRCLSKQMRGVRDMRV
jgi:hypothetical protein